MSDLFQLVDLVFYTISGLTEKISKKTSTGSEDSVSS